MDIQRKETLSVRIISVGFSCLAFAVFKPMGLGQLGMMIYVYLLAIWLLGIAVCYFSESVVRFVVRMPATMDRGVEYIIRRNLWFQLINSPLEALLTCTVLHFPMIAVGAVSPLSWNGYLQTLLIIAFCSFAIGLYWRFKFRSRYLILELEQTRKVNVRPKELQPQSSVSLTLTGTTSDTVTVDLYNLLYIESVGNYVKVCHWNGGKVHCDMLRTTSRQVENDLKQYPMIVRCHRAFLVNIEMVDQIVSKAGSMQLLMKNSQVSIPVSRSHSATLAAVLQ